MSKWFSRLRDAVASGPGAALTVSEALRGAQEARVRIELFPLDTSPKASVLVTTIEQVREGDFVIGQPVTDGSIRQIARFEQLQVSFSTARGRVTGQVENLGRIKIRAGDGGELYGYRLSMPRDLKVTDRRDELRILLGRDLCCEGKLQVVTRKGPINGIIEDICANGARMRCRNGGEHIQRDRPAHFEVELPEPVGLVQQVVRIVGVSSDPATGDYVVRMLFDEKIAAIDEALRRARRRAA